MLGVQVYVRITENNLLATAPAAIKQRIINRRRPRVFLLVLPLKKGSDVVSDIVDEISNCRERLSYICSLR